MLKCIQSGGFATAWAADVSHILFQGHVQEDLWEATVGE